MKQATALLILACLIWCTGCRNDEPAHAVYPLSDTLNLDGWVLSEDLSDEFEAAALDTSKWYVTGTGGKYFGWKGRAPSQFAPHNVRLEDGKLKLRSQWEPDFDFADHQQDGRDYENITTAAVLSHNKILYGYMEIKCKPGDAAMTSSFWTTGYQSELDMFEMMGKPKMGEQLKDNYYLFSIHDWRPKARVHHNKVFTHAHKLPYRVADDFHVYACEWDDNYLKFYADGDLVYTLTKEEMDSNWVVTNPLQIWFDSEVFPWLGIPVEEDLPVDYEIEYVRIWQKPDPNLLDRAFFGFEGPIVLREVRKPERDRRYSKYWALDTTESAVFGIYDGMFTGGRKSLRFEQSGGLNIGEMKAGSPEGSINLPSGKYILSMNLWLETGSNIDQISPLLADPLTEISPVDLSTIPTGEWVTVKREFSRKEASGSGDHLDLTIGPGEGSGTLYIDDIMITIAH